MSGIVIDTVKWILVIATKMPPSLEGISSKTRILHLFRLNAEASICGRFRRSAHGIVEDVTAMEGRMCPYCFARCQRYSDPP